MFYRNHCRGRTGLGLARQGGIIAIFALLLISLISGHLAQAQQDDAPVVRVISITGTIDLGLAPYLERVINDAAEDGNAAVLLEIDTPGGRLDAVLQMQDTLLGSPVRTIAYVNRTAFSAGALITIASEEIYMAPGAVVGAATPVDGGTGDTASEKVVSAVRSTFRTTAEARGRDPRVAEAMVDPEIEVDGLVTRGQLLTLTTTEAIEWGYSEGVMATRADVLDAAGLSGATIVETSPAIAERLVRFITDPVFAGLLMTIGLLLIVGDFLAGGLGIPAAAGAGLMALFFWGHNLAGLTGWEDAALIVLGLVLIGVELFVIPGFGIAGILGVAALLGGMFMAMVGRDIRTPEQTQQAGFTVMITLLLFIVGLIGILLAVQRTTRFGGLVLTAGGPGSPEASSARASRRTGWLGWFGNAQAEASLPVPVLNTAVPRANQLKPGAEGIALTDLRPSGAAEINGQRVDVVSDAEFLSAGEPIVIIRDEGYRRVVRRKPGA